MKEIEVKYLLGENNIDYSTEYFRDFYNSIDELLKDAKEKGINISQGYFNLKNKPYQNIIKELKLKINFKIFEARLRKKGTKFYFTVKSKGHIERDEFEIEITKQIFEKYWSKTKQKINKIRVEKTLNNLKYEFDIYQDQDLITAELEVENIETLKSIKPLGKDISSDLNYKNKNLAL